MTKLATHQKRLKRLYRWLPSSICKDGCSDCCGTTPHFNKVERATVLAYINESEIREAPRGAGCPYLVGGLCDIHEVKPMNCRTFGLIDAPLFACGEITVVPQLMPLHHARQMYKKYNEMP